MPGSSRCPSVTSEEDPIIHITPPHSPGTPTVRLTTLTSFPQGEPLLIPSRKDDRDYDTNSFNFLGLGGFLSH
jgi:hypothetical protein